MLKIFFYIFLLLHLAGCSGFFQAKKLRKIPNQLNWLMSCVLEQGALYEGRMEPSTAGNNTHLTRIETYDDSHRIMREDLYFDGKLLHSSAYAYDEYSNITESQDFDSENNLILSQTYLYHQDNSLWQISQNNSIAIYENNYLYSYKDNQILVVDYFQSGLLTRSQTYHARLLSMEKNYVYRGGFLVEKLIENTEDLSTILEYYNKDQLLIAKTFLINEEFKENEQYQYQGRKLVGKIVEDEDGNRRKFSYSYDTEGMLKSTDIYENDILVERVLYISSQRYMIYYYAFGEVRMIETYENDALIEQKLIELNSTS